MYCCESWKVVQVLHSTVLWLPGEKEYVSQTLIIQMSLYALVHVDTRWQYFPMFCPTNVLLEQCGVSQ